MWDVLEMDFEARVLVVFDNNPIVLDRRCAAAEASQVDEVKAIIAVDPNHVAFVNQERRFIGFRLSLVRCGLRFRLTLGF